MRRFLTTALAGFVLFAVCAATGRAEVRRVRMKIDGYLCGN